MDHDAAKRMLNQIGSGWDILICYACTRPIMSMFTCPNTSLVDLL